MTSNGEAASSLGEDANLLMLIQVPLKYREPRRSKMESFLGLGFNAPTRWRTESYASAAAVRAAGSASTKPSLPAPGNGLRGQPGMNSMQALGQGLFIVGLAVLTGAHFWVVFRALKKSTLWGLLVFLVPGMTFAYIAMNFVHMKRPAIALAAGFFVFGASAWVSRYAEFDRALHQELAPFARPSP